MLAVMHTNIRLLAAIALLSISACTSTRAGDDLAAASIARGSDPRAVAIAQEVIDAAGGRAAWDELRVLEWTSAHGAHHVWDKQTGEYRLDHRGTVCLVDLDSGTGRVFEANVEVLDEPRRTAMLARGPQVWNESSFWLRLPFELLDPGVIVRDVGQRKLGTGEPADVVRVTFEGDDHDMTSGAYELYVTRGERRIAEWTWFERTAATQPDNSGPWRDWSEYAGVWLSPVHGAGYETTDIVVHDAPPASLRAP